MAFRKVSGEPFGIKFVFHGHKLFLNGLFGLKRIVDDRAFNRLDGSCISTLSRSTESAQIWLKLSETPCGLTPDKYKVFRSNATTKAAFQRKNWCSSAPSLYFEASRSPH